MRNFAFFALFVFLIFGCNNQNKNQQAIGEKSAEMVVLSVDELIENADDFVDKEVLVKGTVMHVCKQGGGRCFLMGSNENINIRVEAGEKIGAFSQDQMGSDLEITGVLRIVRTEADAHNPAREHGEEGADHKHDKEAEEAHRIIAETQDVSEVVYFVEGLKINKEEI